MASTSPGSLPSLISRPFHQAGSVISLRQFTNNAFNHHHGIQSEERFGVGVDAAAQGVYKALAAYGLRVPEEMSVVGFDATEAAMLNPPLTTVGVFPEQVGRQLAEMLVSRITRPDLPPQQSYIPTQLVKRESCHRLSPMTEEKGSESPDQPRDSS